jgi:hypothetical protein
MSSEGLSAAKRCLTAHARAADHWRHSTNVIQRRASAVSQAPQRAHPTERRGASSGDLKASLGGRSLPRANGSARGSPDLGHPVRERRDLASEWHAKDKLLIAGLPAKSEPLARRNTTDEQAFKHRLTAIDTPRRDQRAAGQRFPGIRRAGEPGICGCRLKFTPARYK